MSQLILHPFFRFSTSQALHLSHFTYITAHSPTLLSLYLCHSSSSKLTVASPMSQLILQPFFRFSYVTGSSLISLHLHHRSFSNPSVALPMSQLIFQHFRCFTYVTAHSPTLLSLLPRHRLFTYLTSPISQLILQPFCRFTYVTVHPPTFPLLHLCHSSFFNHSFASPTSLSLHLPHLASRPYHFPTFRRKMLSAFSRVIDYLTHTENWALVARIYPVTVVHSRRSAQY